MWTQKKASLVFDILQFCKRNIWTSCDLFPLIIIIILPSWEMTCTAPSRMTSELKSVGHVWFILSADYRYSQKVTFMVLWDDIMHTAVPARFVDFDPLCGKCRCVSSPRCLLSACSREAALVPPPPCSPASVHIPSVSLRSLVCLSLRIRVCFALPRLRAVKLDLWSAMLQKKTMARQTGARKSQVWMPSQKKILIYIYMI